MLAVLPVASTPLVCFHPCLQVDYRQLLDVFFDRTDPTTLNRQGNDRGTQYRSGVYWHDEEQRAAAEQKFAEVNEQLKQVGAEAARDLAKWGWTRVQARHSGCCRPLATSWRTCLVKTFTLTSPVTMLHACWATTTISTSQNHPLRL